MTIRFSREKVADDENSSLHRQYTQMVAAERDIDLNSKFVQNHSPNNNNNNHTTNHKKSKKSVVAAWLKSAASSSSSSSNSSASTASSNSLSSSTGGGNHSSHHSTPNTMDLLQLLAINALEFTAPASAAFFLEPSMTGSTAQKDILSPSLKGTATVNGPSCTNKKISNSSSNNSSAAMPAITTIKGGNEVNKATNKIVTIEDSSSSGPPLHQIRRAFVQLSGHPGCFAPAGPSTLWKKQAEGSYETKVYEYLSNSDDPMSLVIPTFHSQTEWNGEIFLEIEDLLTRFDPNPHVMDLKIGFRTFLESEVTNSSERSDLYQKMVKVDPNAPTEKEHAAKAVTKLRYMQFREEQSSTSSLGFRIEAIKFPNSKEPMSDLKTVKTEAQVAQVMEKFLPADPGLRSDLMERLKNIRSNLENSDFFMNHEVIGSSVLLIHDSSHVGAWIIDFAKTVQRPVRVTHRRSWQMGNHEDGYLVGLDNLIRVAESPKS